MLYVTTSSKKILIKLTAPPLWLAVALPIAYFTAAVVTVSLA